MRGIGFWRLLAAIVTCVATVLVATATAGATTRLEQNGGLNLVIMGDSYSAGVGTQTTRTHDNTCERTNLAWGNLLAAQTADLTLKANLACSGAHIGDLFSPFKGETAQVSRLKALNPDVVALTIGGNDAGFSTALYNCFRYNCDKGKLLPNGAAVDGLRSQLARAFVQLQQSAPEANIALVGYPRIFPALGKPIVNCDWLNRRELDDLDQLSTDLDSQERQAVGDASRQLGSASHLQYISTLNAFSGHELCSQDSWVFALRPTCLLDSRCGHPQLAGQQAIASAVVRALKLPKPKAGSKPAPGKADKWPTRRNDGTPVFFEAAGIDLTGFPSWSSCNIHYCLVGIGRNVYLYSVEKDIKQENHALASGDPRSTLQENFGLSEQDIDQLLAPASP